MALYAPGNLRFNVLLLIESISFFVSSAILEGNAIDGEYYNWSKALLEDNNPTEILAAILNYCFEDELNPEAYGEIKDIAAKGKQIDKQGKPDFLSR